MDTKVQPETPILGQVIDFALPEAEIPAKWVKCDGQLLAVGQYPAWVAKAGTTWGGDGVNDAGVPDLRHRVTVGVSSGGPLADIALAAQVGGNSVTLTTGEIPSHTHTARGNASTGNVTLPTNAVWANSGVGDTDFNNTPGDDVDMHANAIKSTGGGLAHENRQATTGIYKIIRVIP